MFWVRITGSNLTDTGIEVCRKVCKNDTHFELYRFFFWEFYACFIPVCYSAAFVVETEF